MPTHRRGRSLSEALTLEESEEGALVISSVTNASHHLKEGDEILGATIDFDQLSKEEVINLLKLMKPFDDKVKVLTRSNLSKSVDSLDQCARNPEEMLKDSYSKLYNAKIKRFVKDDSSAAGKSTVATSSKVNLKHDMGLPRLGVDFGLLQSTLLSADANSGSEFEVGELMDGSNLNLPPLGVSLNGPTAGDTSVQRLRLDARNPQSRLRDYHLSRTLPDDLNDMTAAGDLKMPNPDTEVIGPDGISTVPKGKLSLEHSKLKTSHLNLDDPSSFMESPDVRLSGTLPQMDLGNVDVDTPSGSVTLPNIGYSGHGTDNMLDFSLKNPKIKSGMSAPDANLSKFDLKGTNLATDTPSARVKGPFGKYKAPKFTMPKFDLPYIAVPNLNGDAEFPDVKMQGVDVSAPKLKGGIDFKGDFNTPDVDYSMPNVDMKRGGINMPDINMPKANFKTPKLDLSGPKADLNMPSGELKMPEIQGPDWDVSAPSGKLKMPKMNLSGALPKGPNLDLNADLKSPDWNLKAPKIKGGVNAPDLDLPDMNLKGPKLDVNTPDVNIGSPKGKFKMPKMKMPKFSFPNVKGPELDGNLNAPDIDVNAPDLNLKGPKTGLDLDMPDLSGKFKKPNLNLPDLNLSGPKIDSPNLDLKSPDLDVSGPNLRGGINMPKINMPKANFKTPKLDLSGPKADLNMPSGELKMPEIQGPDWDVSAPSGKLKMPKMNLSGTLPKGPNLDLNADLKSPDFSVKAPKVKGGVKGFEFPDVGFGSPSGKVKKHHLKMPNVGFSGSKLNGSDLDVSKIKGGLDSPNLSLSKTDFRNSMPDFDVPDVDFGTSPIKMPKSKIPDVGFSGPKLDDPKFNAKLPKGQNLKLNPELNSPELNLGEPNMKGGVSSFKPSAPNVNLQAPKLDANTLDGDIGLPSANLKKPQMKMPKGLNANLTSELQGPGLNMPRISGNGPKGSGPKLRGPDLSLPALDLADVRVNGPKLSGKHPNMRMYGNMGQPQMNFSGPRMTGDLSGARMGMNTSLIDIRGPHVRSPNFNIQNASMNFKGASYQNHRSAMAGMSLKRPDLDIDQDIRLNRKSAQTNVRSSYPAVDHALHQYIDFNRSDLNIDDFTGKDHVLRARGSQLDLWVPPNYQQRIPSSRVYVDPRNSRGLLAGSRDLSMQRLSQKVPDGPGGYYVTVFPKQAQPQRVPNSKFNTSRLGFPTGTMDLEVPDENYLKGSTFFFSNLV